jgi:Ca-activated chloride channel homolog
VKRSGLILLVCAVAASELRGQVAPKPGSVFRSGIDLVALNVVVTDTHQKFVKGLLPADFAVFEDDVQQELSFFAADDAPLDLAILLDTSASMADKMGTVRQAAKGLVSTLHKNDRIMVVDIKDSTRVLHPLSLDTAAASAAIQQIQAGGGTGLFNGLYMTMKELVKVRRGMGHDVRRQAIVVLSDGLDTASLMSFDDVMDVAKQSGVATYTITLRTPDIVALGARDATRIFEPSDYSMKSLAQETGARAFFPMEVSELKNVYSSIATDLANQYAMAYTPKNGRLDGAFRRIMVRVTDRPDVRARTRSGYTPPRGTRTGTLE